MGREFFMNTTIGKGITITGTIHAEEPVTIAGTVKGDVLASEFDVVRRQLPISLQPAITDLEAIVRQRLQLERQRRLHRIMHFWLLFHVPASYAMLIFSGVHVVMPLRYSRLG